MGNAQNTVALEKNLSLVMGCQIRLHSLEVHQLTPDSIKRAYYRRAHECHPDKAASLGVAPELLAGRFRSLQDAYSYVLDSWDSGALTELFAKPEMAAGSAAGNAAGMYAHSAAATGTASTVHAAYTAPTTYAGHTARATRTSDAASAGYGRNFTEAWHRWSVPSVKPKALVYHEGAIPRRRLRFAQYLYYSRRIDWDTLIRALSWQFHTRPTLGELGTELGFMRAEDVLGVLRHKKAGELFGEAAVRLGYLSPYQLSVLMGRQRLLNLPIGRFFVENGYLGRDELTLSLESMKRHNFYIRTGLRTL